MDDSKHRYFICVFFESQQLSAMRDLWTWVYFVSVTGDVSADTIDQYS